MDLIFEIQVGATPALKIYHIFKNTFRLALYRGIYFRGASAGIADNIGRSRLEILYLKRCNQSLAPASPLSCYQQARQFAHVAQLFFKIGARFYHAIDIQRYLPVGNGQFAISRGQL